MSKNSKIYQVDTLVLALPALRLFSEGPSPLHSRPPSNDTVPTRLGHPRGWSSKIFKRKTYCSRIFLLEIFEARVSVKPDLAGWVLLLCKKDSPSSQSTQLVERVPDASATRRIASPKIASRLEVKMHEKNVLKRNKY